MLTERRRKEVVRRDMRSTLRRLETRPRLVTRGDWQRAHRADIRLHSRRYYPVTTEEQAEYNKEFEASTGQRRSGWMTGDELITLINVSMVIIVAVVLIAVVASGWWAIFRAVGLVD